MLSVWCLFFFFSSRRRHTRCALVTGVQTCALPISFPPVIVYTGQDLSPDDELRLRKYSKSIIIKGAKSPERLLDEVTLFLHQVVSELPDQHQKMLTKSLNRDAVLENRQDRKSTRLNSSH